MEIIKRSWNWGENFGNKICTAKYNPLNWLGAISCFIFLILTATGIYLFLFYEISAKNAYQSIEHLTVNQWYLGGLIRSMHRYASAGLIVSMTLHTIQMFVKNRYRSWRWLTWVSGVSSIWVTIFIGLLGYTMVWDETALFIARTFTPLLDNLPFSAKPLSFAFLKMPSNLFFRVIVFSHLVVPILLLCLFGFHTARMRNAKIVLPKELMYMLLAVFFIVSIITPATSGPPADMNMLPAKVRFDWFYMFFFPLFNIMTVPAVWGILSISTIFLFFVPWYGKRENKTKNQNLSTDKI
jgi:quinol-cytochrome oxidoreductase complex cytochrome b subunit